MRYGERKRPAGLFEHHIHPRLLEERVYVHLVGCGGNGSQMLTGLARFAVAMAALGHPGIRVIAFDGDAVSPANVGRQLFSPSDVGQNKATVLIHRLNSFYGLDWYAEPAHWGSSKSEKHADILISCVDTRETRAAIGWFLDTPGGHPYYWLDVGNRAADGQVILGCPSWDKKHRRMWGRLPTVLELFPEIDGRSARRLDRADRQPSCSLAEALGRQELFVNQHVTTWALQLLWQVFRHRKTTWHGAFINAETGRVSPLPCDLDAWARFGYRARPEKARKKP